MKKGKEFKLVECRGTPYEIGQQWGAGCKENIIKALENSFNLMSLMYQAPQEEVVAKAMKFPPKFKNLTPI